MTHEPATVRAMKLLLSAAAVVVLTFAFFSIWVGLESAARAKRWLYADWIWLGLLVLACGGSPYGVWRMTFKPRHRLVVVVATAVALAVLWMAGLLPCSTTLNCPAWVRPPQPWDRP